MTQEEFKEQFLRYAEFNLDNNTILQAVTELLDNTSNELYENGYIKEANTLTTCQLSINEILDKENI